VGISEAGADLLLRDARVTDATAVIIMQASDVAWEYCNPAHEETLLHTGSVTKFVVGRCVAHAMFAGEMESVDAPACRWLTEWSDDERAAITVRHLMRHTSGLPASWDGGEGRALTTEALELMPVARPGTGFAYNNHGAQLVAELLRRASGLPVDEYAAAHIFSPLGISEWRWNHGPDGSPYGMAALQLRPRDLARIGELALHDGAWDGHRIYDSDWGKDCRRPGAEIGLFEMLLGSYAVTVDLTGCRGLDQRIQEAVQDLDGTTLPLHGGGSLLSRLAAHLPGAEVQPAFHDLRAAAPATRLNPVDPRAFGHDGSGGQHLWVIPEADAVAVRMRRVDERIQDPRATSAFATIALEAVHSC
jgi:CubicO group peptidase (beta-lactamase class C family)